MDVVLGVRGDVVVDDHVDVRYVQAAGGDVGGEEDGAGLGLELVEGAQPLVLAHVAVQGDGGEAQGPVECGDKSASLYVWVYSSSIQIIISQTILFLQLLRRGGISPLRCFHPLPP